MEKLALKAEVRGDYGKSYSRELRNKGQIPAVLYGKDQEPLALAISEKEMHKVVGKNSLIDLDFEMGTEVVVLKDVQRDPLKGFLRHADFHSINLNDKITITVPIHLEGTPEGVKVGGVLQYQKRDIELECLPTEMPKNLCVDVSHLNVGESLHIGDIDVSENMIVLSSPDEVVASVILLSSGETTDEEGVDEEQVE